MVNHDFTTKAFQEKSSHVTISQSTEQEHIILPLGGSPAEGTQNRSEQEYPLSLGHIVALHMSTC